MLTVTDEILIAEQQPNNPSIVSMTRGTRNAKLSKKTWDSDKAIKSTYKGLVGKYQLRAYLLLALAYGIVAAWLTEMPTFALLSPKYIDCTPIYPNQTFIQSNSNLSAENVSVESTRRAKPTYNYTKEYGRTVLTDFNALCDKTRVRIPYIAYILGLILGGLILGFLADRAGRKMVLLGSMWTACALSIFQLLSQDYISYVFFIFFLGITIGAIHVIIIPYVMEMFPSDSRAIYGLSLLGVVFLFDLAIPWLAVLLKNWKILQAVITVPLIFTAVLYWITKESMFYYTAEKDYTSAVLSLIDIAKFNGVIFEDVFREAQEFLRGKRSKEVQCDFQPLLRLEDIKTFSTKYPDFDMVDLHATTTKKLSLTTRIFQVISGHHYNPHLSKFYPTDIFHSPILTIYLFVMCGLWLVSSLTEYSLDVRHVTRHLTNDFYWNYFYTHLIQIISFIIALPLVHVWGRRWPTFCFFLIAEVCLLGSVAVKLDDAQTRPAMLIVYFIGKFATRAAFIILLIYTCEIFPTGLRCTVLGICYTFRWIGIALASPDVGEINDWMPRLIYGILSLILGALALLLPETKSMPLSRTMLTVENIPTTISQHFRRRRAFLVKKNIQSNKTRPTEPNAFNDATSVISAVRSNRPYDNQSTIHSIYELQELGPDDTIHSIINRHSSRRIDARSPPFYQGYNINEQIRHQQSIAEDVEFDDDEVEDDRTMVVLEHRLSSGRTKDDVIIIPDASKSVPSHGPSDVPSQLEVTAQIQAGDVTGDHSALTTTGEINDGTNRNHGLSQSPKYQRAMSQDENYFSEHC